MTTTPDVPAPVAPVGVACHDASWEAARTDAVLSGRNMSAAVFLAGLLDAAELETAGRPDRLPQDLFPHVDPVVVEAIWKRALAVGLHAGRVSSSPRLYRDQLARVRGEFEAIGFEAMARSVGRSRRLVASHPADGETARVVNCGVSSRTGDTREVGGTGVEVKR